MVIDGKKVIDDNVVKKLCNDYSTIVRFDTEAFQNQVN